MTLWQMDTSRRGQVRLPPTGEINIYLVGTGGTGSFLAQSLARLAWHARTRGVQVELTFVDPDRVEEKNVGRQLFCLAEGGHYKAETLATRFNAAFGLRICAVPYPVAVAALEVPAGSRPDQRLVLGAVDTHLARRDIYQLVTRWRSWWCDAGKESLYRESGSGTTGTRIGIGRAGVVSRVAPTEPARLRASGAGSSGNPYPLLRRPHGTERAKSYDQPDDGGGGSAVCNGFCGAPPSHHVSERCES